jgi:hypothetical protein
VLENLLAGLLAVAAVGVAGYAGSIVVRLYREQDQQQG